MHIVDIDHDTGNAAGHITWPVPRTAVDVPTHRPGGRPHSGGSAPTTGGAWRTIGDRSLPPPIVRALRYEHRLRDYAPNDPPLWDRLLHALHERGGTSFDPDEAVSPREYLDVDPRLDANAGFGQ